MYLKTTLQLLVAQLLNGLFSRASLSTGLRVVGSNSTSDFTLFDLRIVVLYLSILCYHFVNVRSLSRYRNIPAGFLLLRELSFKTQQNIIFIFLFYHFDFQSGAWKIVSLGCLSVGFHAALFAFAMSMPIITREFYLSFPSGNDFGKSHMDKNILTFSGGLMWFVTQSQCYANQIH